MNDKIIYILESIASGHLDLDKSNVYDARCMQFIKEAVEFYIKKIQADAMVISQPDIE